MIIKCKMSEKLLEKSVLFNKQTVLLGYILFVMNVLLEYFNNLLVPKEALIDVHNLKPLFTVHKESIDW